jgi:hypothetical protein
MNLHSGRLSRNPGTLFAASGSVSGGSGIVFLNPGSPFAHPGSVSGDSGRL